MDSQKIFNLTSNRGKISGLLSTAGFNVGLKWPEYQVIDTNSYFLDFKLVITSYDRPCSLRHASTFKRLRTRRHLSFSVLSSKPTQLDRSRHGPVFGEVQVQTKVGSSGICGGQSGSGRVFFLGGGRICFHLSVSFRQHSVRVYSPVTDGTQSVSADSVSK